MSRELNPFEIKLNGKLMTGKDPSVIGSNFQSLKNLRYDDEHPEGIGGMSRINSSAPTTGSTSNPKIRSGFHFNKEQPSESHVLVHAFKTNGTNPRIYENETAIPTTGEFNTTPLFTNTDTVNFRNGIFSDAPNENVIFCDGKDSLIWGGDETRTSVFINYAPDDSFRKNYTKQIQNTSTGANDVATIGKYDAGDIDSNTELLLHFDNSSTDDSAQPTAHVVTNNGAVTYDAVNRKFGTHSASFDGSSQFFSIPDNADFNSSRLTIEFQIRQTSSTVKRTYWSQATDATHRYSLYSSTDGKINFDIINGASTQTITSDSSIVLNTWQHVAFTSSPSFYTLFIDGIVNSVTAWSTTMNDYTGSVIIGAENDNTSGLISTDFYKGQIDEERYSSVTRYNRNSNFEPPAVAFGEDASYMYLGATRPLRGFKPYIGTANSSTGTMTVDEWDGDSWNTVTNLVDNTSSSGVSLSQTGMVTFDSTVGTSKVRAIDDIVLYWYRVIVANTDSTTTIYYLTENAPMQQIKDIWDGEYRSCLSFITEKTTTHDDTPNVLEEDYDSQNDATYSNISTSGSDFYLLTGFQERAMGVNFKLVGSFVNLTANTISTVEYWNGTTWTNVGVVNDGTIVGGISMAKSGTITWSPIDEASEFTKETFASKKRFLIGEAETFDPSRGANVTAKAYETRSVVTASLPLYYYKFTFSQDLLSDVRLDSAAGIPSPKNIKGFNYSMMSDNRVFLLGQEDERKNKLLISSVSAPDVYNGLDSLELLIGDEKALVGGANLYSILGSNVYDNKILFKNHKMFNMVGNNIDDYRIREITTNDGLAAPKTLKRTLTALGGTPANILIWQGNNGIYMFDNRAKIPIHGDIDNFFNKREPDATRRISLDYANRSDAFIDEENGEYHWCFADATSTGQLNREFSFDLVRGKWYEIDRNSSNNLQSGFTVVDTDGNNYNYGSKDTGHLLRLENGNDFDGESINHEMQFGDMAVDEGKITSITGLRKIRMITKSTTATTATIVGTHYVDGATTASSTFTLNPIVTGKRLASGKQMKHSLSGEPNGIFHSLKFNINTTGENVGFTPLYVGGHYKKVREDE